MHGNAQPDSLPFGGSELRSYLSPLCRPKYTKLSLPLQSVRSLQRRFLTDDVLLRSGDIHDQLRHTDADIMQ